MISRISGSAAIVLTFSRNQAQNAVGRGLPGPRLIVGQLVVLDVDTRQQGQGLECTTSLAKHGGTCEPVRALL